MRSIKKIIIHCSDTKANQNFNIEDIERWHVQDNGWSKVGYHYVITRTGIVQSKYGIEEPGIHCANHNSNSIGICLIGGKGADGKPEDNFTHAQLTALIDLIQKVSAKTECTVVKGHNFYNKDKACPCFDVDEFMKEYEVLGISG